MCSVVTKLFTFSFAYLQIFAIKLTYNVILTYKYVSIPMIMLLFISICILLGRIIGIAKIMEHLNKSNVCTHLLHKKGGKYNMI